jgi:hypothetical protein
MSKDSTSAHPLHDSGRACVYFVASPLQLIAAQQIARTHEAGARQVLVWYQPGVTALVDESAWDACAYMPWPRWRPMPGWFGRHRRLLANIDLVADLVGRCDSLHLHSAVYDTEAINYFLRALPYRCGARTLRARILPDGLISIRRYPLSAARRAVQWVRKLRRLVSPTLDYWTFRGDRIGSDAAFCDRIYVLAGWPHQYDRSKVVELEPLGSSTHAGSGVRPSANATGTVDGPCESNHSASERRALVIGQPLAAAGLMSTADRDDVALEMEAWLAAQGYTAVDYKGHPKDSANELCRPGYRVLQLTEPLETWLAHTPYRAVVGVRSTALPLARQLCAPHTQVIAFGWDRTLFKSDAERADMRALFDATGVQQHRASLARVEESGR